MYEIKMKYTSVSSDLFYVYNTFLENLYDNVIELMQMCSCIYKSRVHCEMKINITLFNIA